MNFHLISFTDSAFTLAQRINSLLGPSEENSIILCKRGSGISLSDWTKNHFQKGNCLIFLGAAGIAVRAIAPFINNKAEDPAVLVIDEKGEFVIPLLSGHIGGANGSAKKIASLIGARAVITTASDVNNIPAIDEFAEKNGLAINSMEKAKEFAADMLKYSKAEDKSLLKRPGFSISVYIKNDILNLIPRCLLLGIGCKKGKSPLELKNFVNKVLKSHNLDYRSLESLNSVDLKAGEKALISLSEDFKLPFVTFSSEELNKVKEKVSHSDFVSTVTGTDNVCERAVFAAGADRLLVKKTACNGMTIAIGIKKIALDIPEILKDSCLEMD